MPSGRLHENCFREPVIAAQAGGSRGGGAALTPFGTQLIDQYRAIEAEAHAATAARLDELEAACKGVQETAAKSHAAPRHAAGRSSVRIRLPADYG